MAKRGPKPLAGIPKTNFLRIMLTESERAELDDAASGESKATSTWARELLLSAAKRRKK